MRRFAYEYRPFALKNMTFPRASIHLWAEIFYEIYSTEVAEKKLVLYFSFLQQLLVRIPQICTVNFHACRRYGLRCILEISRKISRTAKSDASQPAAGAASHEMVVNSPPSPLQHGWAVQAEGDINQRKRGGNP